MRRRPYQREKPRIASLYHSVGLSDATWHLMHRFELPCGDLLLERNCRCGKQTIVGNGVSFPQRTELAVHACQHILNECRQSFLTYFQFVFINFKNWYLSTSVSCPNIDNPLLFFPFVRSLLLSLSRLLSFRFSLALHVIPFNKNAFSTSTQFPGTRFHNQTHTLYSVLWYAVFFLLYIFECIT